MTRPVKPHPWGEKGSGLREDRGYWAATMVAQLSWVRLWLCKLGQVLYFHIGRVEQASSPRYLKDVVCGLKTQNPSNPTLDSIM